MFFLSRGRCRFTLVELLVVIAIIGILSSLLMPSLGRARMLALSAECKSNVRQIASANMMYADDFDGFFAPFASDMMTTNKHRWHGTSSTGSNSGDAEYSHNSNLFASYLGGDGAINQCKAFITPDVSNSFEMGSGGYGYNTMVGTMGEGYTPELYASGISQAGIKNPTRKVMFADAAMPVSKSGGWGRDVLGFSSSIEPPGGAWEMYPTMHFRHNGYANIAYCDGHVEDKPLVDSAYSYDEDWNLGHPYENNNKSRLAYYSPRGQ